MVGGYMMVCYDLPDADGESGTAQDVRCSCRLSRVWHCTCRLNEFV